MSVQQQEAGGTASIERRGGVGIVTIEHRQRRNALSTQVREALFEAFSTLMSEESCRAIVLTGAGGSFCSGGDLTALEGLSAAEGRARMTRIHRLVRTMVEGEKPVVAAVEGWAAGAGMVLAGACDIVVAASDARFTCSFNKVGLMPDLGAAYVLPLRMGMGRARMAMLTGDVLDAAAAQRAGLVELTVDPGRALDEAVAIAERIARAAPCAVGMTKAQLARMPQSLTEMLRAEADAQALLFTSRDFEEGRRAFLEKRPARFVGE